MKSRVASKLFRDKQILCVGPGVEAAKSKTASITTVIQSKLTVSAGYSSRSAKSQESFAHYNVGNGCRLCCSCPYIETWRLDGV